MKQYQDLRQSVRSLSSSLSSLQNEIKKKEELVIIISNSMSIKDTISSLKQDYNNTNNDATNIDKRVTLISLEGNSNINTNNTNTNTKINTNT